MRPKRSEYRGQQSWSILQRVAILILYQYRLEVGGGDGVAVDVAAVANHVAAGGPDIAHHRVGAGEDEDIEQAVAGLAGKVDVSGVERQEVGPLAGGDPAGFAPRGIGSAWARAGASFTPSPVIAAVSPSA